ncbi:hypothetical protein ACKVWC_000046 [Pyricularia oryzae]
MVGRPRSKDKQRKGTKIHTRYFPPVIPLHLHVLSSGEEKKRQKEMSTYERLRDERCSLYKRAFPDANWDAAREECASLPTVADRVAYITDNFPGLIRIACLNAADPIQAHVERARKAFTQIIRHPDNAGKTGADLGLTGVPPIMRSDPLDRYAVNSSIFTLGEAGEIARSTPKVHGGATVHVLMFFLPSRDGDPSAMHGDTLVIPDDERDELYINSTSISYQGPMFHKERTAMMENLGVTELFRATSDATLDRLLLADDISVWGGDGITVFLKKEHAFLSSVELLSQVRNPALEKLANGAPCMPLFDLRMSCSVKVTKEEHMALRRLKTLGDLSVSRGHVLMAGRGTPENSCFFGCFYDLSSVKQGFYPPEKVYATHGEQLIHDLIDRADGVYLAKEAGRRLRITDYIEDRDEYFQVAPKQAGHETIKKFFESPSLFNLYQGGSKVSWANRYTTYADPLPEDVLRFFALATDIFATHVEELAASLP